MKKAIILLLCLAFVGFNSVAQEINWVSLEEAIALQKKNPKKIIMDAYTEWCGPCKMLDRNTFHNNDVVNYINEHFYAVKFNAEGNETITYQGKTFDNPNYDPAKAKRRNGTHRLTSYLKVSAYPTLVFFDEKGDYITPIVGYQTPQQLELYLKLFKDDHHKNMKSQEDFNDFYEAFKPEFKS
ncbi:thioredoxin fold domain-containing protein [Yeosuana sp. MJ-SS3]|uniref:Thioredoxin fold domain-containing protein n=1 Tax=Gilvirhabdus luticola TaxID=3079858 RepID=A0ABU3U4D2_9FLAO|nr:thioredoxin fold domain-containing protein [Yeosuana sp. MJ-SS3]MDU8885177.1 thioredoxin fold domain-containing protein [Yeosuana sp. MJ-SS3]